MAATRKPESQETFDDDFTTKGLNGDQCMARTEESLVSCRLEAADLAKEWLLKHGYFNGEITSDVTLKGQRCYVRVVLTCYGLPLVLETG